MSAMPLRDPVTGRFVSSKLKKQEPVVTLAYTVVYVVCFCTFALMIGLAIFFMQTRELKTAVIENRNIIEEIRDNGEALVIVPELPESEYESPYTPPAEELEGAPDPVSDTEKPQRKVRVFRGSEVTEYEL